MITPEAMFRSVLEEDRAPVVLCALDHSIVYMNPAAKKRYAKYGGETLLGKSLRKCHNEDSNRKMDEILAWFRKDPANNRVFTSRNDAENKDVYMIALRDADGTLIGYYEKHEYRDAETHGMYDIGS